MSYSSMPIQNGSLIIR